MNAQRSTRDGSLVQGGKFMCLTNGRAKPFGAFFVRSATPVSYVGPPFRAFQTPGFSNAVAQIVSVRVRPSERRSTFPALVALSLLACGLAGAVIAKAQSSYEPYAVSTIAGATPAVGGDTVGDVKGFNLPSGVAVDSAGNLYVANTNDHTIRKVTSAGLISTLAGAAGSPGYADGAGGAALFLSQRRGGGRRR